MKIIAVYSSKGGVGKTATSVNLAYTASLMGNKVLLCDMDSQGAASYYFRIRPKKKFNSKKLLSGQIGKYIRGTDFSGLDLLPAHFSFRNLDLALDKLDSEDRGLALSRIFQPLTEEYDILILDCPPNLTFLAENIILAADVIVTPVIPTTLSLLALDQLVKLFGKLGENKKKIYAFFSMVEKRKTMHANVMSKYQKKSLFLKTSIPFMAEVEKMGIYRLPVGANTRRSLAAGAYLRLWQEIRRKGEKK